MLPFIAGQASLIQKCADRRGITPARSDQQIAVSQPEHKAIGRSVAIKISPEHDIPLPRRLSASDYGKMPAQALPATIGSKNTTTFRQFPELPRTNQN